MFIIDDVVRSAPEVAGWTRDQSGVGDPRFSMNVVSDRFGLRVYTDDRLEKSGTLRLLHGKVAVVVAPATPARRRFAAAHELGHFLLAAVEGIPLAQQLQQPSVEQWCNRFASHLLLPREWLRSELAGEVDTAGDGLRVLLKTAKKADSSLAATVLAVNDGLGLRRRLLRWRMVGRQWQLLSVIGSPARTLSTPGVDELFDALDSSPSMQYVRLLGCRTAVEVRVELFRSGSSVYGLADDRDRELWARAEADRLPG